MQSSDDKFSARREPPPTRRESLLPVFAVAAVAVVAVLAAVMVQRADIDAPREATLAAARPATQRGEVVKAPPLQAPSTRAMGNADACKQCGVVEMVAHPHGRRHLAHDRATRRARRGIARDGRRQRDGQADVVKSEPPNAECAEARKARREISFEMTLRTLRQLCELCVKRFGSVMVDDSGMIKPMS
jgi:hypothetical protein